MAAPMKNKKTSAEAAPVDGRRQLQSQERRRRVLAAANRCFGLHGFRKTSVDMIAEEAGLNTHDAGRDCFPGSVVG